MKDFLLKENGLGKIKSVTVNFMLKLVKDILVK